MDQIYLAIVVAANLGVLVVVRSRSTAWDAVAHSHPAYPTMLAVTAAVSIIAPSTLRRRPEHRWSRITSICVRCAGLLWVAATGWLRPFPAGEPAREPMESSASITVVREAPTQIELTPASGGSSTGVFFQPGARVDAWAYAANLRPLAEEGYPVVIVKQPLGIAVLATAALEDARDHDSQISR